MPNSLQVIIILAATNLERLCQAVLTPLLHSFAEGILTNIHMELSLMLLLPIVLSPGKKIKSLVGSIL